MSHSPFGHIPGPAIKLILDSLDLPWHRENMRLILVHLRNQGNLLLTGVSEFEALLDGSVDLVFFQRQIRETFDQVLELGEVTFEVFYEIDEPTLLAATNSKEAMDALLARLAKAAVAAVDVTHQVATLFQDTPFAELGGFDEGGQRLVISWLAPIAESLSAMKAALDMIAGTLYRVGIAVDEAGYIQGLSDRLNIPHVDWIDRLVPGFGRDHPRR